MWGHASPAKSFPAWPHGLYFAAVCYPYDTQKVEADKALPRPWQVIARWPGGRKLLNQGVSKNQRRTRRRQTTKPRAKSPKSAA